MIVSLDHVQLAMPHGEEAKARAFYGELLGLEETEKPAVLKARGGVWFKIADFGLHLGVMQDFIPATKAHPAFCVTNLDVLANRLLSAKLDINWDDALTGVTRFYVFDPFGNRLEFLEASGIEPKNTIN